LGTKRSHKVKNKKILITSGPTWVPIDNVRVISNIATGETGIFLAEKLQRLGAKVTLVLGPVGACCLNRKINLMRFRFFNELRDIIIKELRSKKYDVIIHSAAVSDYKPAKIYKQKVKSGMKKWRMDLVPTEKIIDLFKKIDLSIFLVGFKFEPNTNKEKLISNARVLIQRSRLNLAVANTISQGKYKAYIVGKQRINGPFLNRDYLIRDLIKALGENL
jgi:phosphopantothenoylcysteine decarboxylase/phosphopantothenate--cysteine ligase